MKRLLPMLLLAVVIFAAGCGKKGTSDDDVVTPSPSATAVSTAAPETSTDAPAPTADTGRTNIERMSPDEVADKVVAEGRTENAFIGQWRAVGTTSGNAAFNAMTVTITKDGYNVAMSFDDYEGQVEYKGEYDLKDGVLTFDESFLDCSAYFYKGDIKTLVIDNGTSLVFCEHLEQEKEMR